MKLSRKEEKIATSCSAVVVAAGDSARFGADKLFLDICGKSVLERSLLAFENCERVSEIVLVVKAERLEEMGERCHEMNIKKLSKIVCGGKTRMHSALNGVCETDRNARLVLIHDAARPLVSAQVIENAIFGAARYAAACPAIALKDTVKTVRDERVVNTPSREELFAVQTPQAFDADLIRGALTRAVWLNAQFTDDCSACEDMGASVFITQGDEENIKITTPMDIEIARLFFEKRVAK